MVLIVTGESDELSTASSSCHQFTPDQWHQLTLARTITGFLSCLACAIAFVLILTFRAYRRFAHRLTLYLTGAAFILSVMYVLQILPTRKDGDIVSIRKGWTSVCTAIAFLDQYTGWVMLLIICWINLYLFLLAAFQYSMTKCKYEVAGILLVVLLPLTYTWIPFISDRYGLAGAWCWIKLSKDSADCNGSYATGLEYQIGLWYGPSIVMTSLSFIGMTALVIALCKWGHSTRNGRTQVLSQQYKNALKEAIPLLVYLVIFNFINCLDIVNRIYFAAVTLKEDLDPYFPLWMANAIAGPGRPLIIPFAFTCSQLKSMLKKKQSSAGLGTVQSYSHTAYAVSNEWSSDEEPLIITQ